MATSQRRPMLTIKQDECFDTTSNNECANSSSTPCPCHNAFSTSVHFQESCLSYSTTANGITGYDSRLNNALEGLDRAVVERNAVMRELASEKLKSAQVYSELANEKVKYAQLYTEMVELKEKNQKLEIEVSKFNSNDFNLCRSTPPDTTLDNTHSMSPWMRLPDAIEQVPNTASTSDSPTPTTKRLVHPSKKRRISIKPTITSICLNSKRLKAKWQPGSTQEESRLKNAVKCLKSRHKDAQMRNAHPSYDEAVRKYNKLRKPGSTTAKSQAQGNMLRIRNSLKDCQCGCQDEAND